MWSVGWRQCYVGFSWQWRCDTAGKEGKASQRLCNGHKKHEILSPPWCGVPDVISLPPRGWLVTRQLWRSPAPVPLPQTACGQGSRDKSLTYGCLQTLPLISSLGHRFLRFTVPDQHIFAQEVPPGLVETSRSLSYPQGAPSPSSLTGVRSGSPLSGSSCLRCFRSLFSFTGITPNNSIVFLFPSAICFPETPLTGCLGDGTYLEPSFAVCCWSVRHSIWRWLDQSWRETAQAVGTVPYLHHCHHSYSIHWPTLQALERPKTSLWST